jgi:hypothetical protein
MYLTFVILIQFFLGMLVKSCNMPVSMKGGRPGSKFRKTNPCKYLSILELLVTTNERVS